MYQQFILYARLGTATQCTAVWAFDSADEGAISSQQLKLIKDIRLVQNAKETFKNVFRSLA